MDKEDFYEMMFKMCSLLKTDYDNRFESILDVLDFSDEMKEEFNEMIPQYEN